MKDKEYRCNETIDLEELIENECRRENLREHKSDSNVQKRENGDDLRKAKEKPNNIKSVLKAIVSFKKLPNC